ncbi:MAG: nucleotide exchange factor GrpE [bacterium]
MKLDLHENEQNKLLQTDLAEAIQSLQEELLKERDLNLRTLADFANYRRRIERDGNKIAEESKRGMFISMLEIVDDIEKALQSAVIEKQSPLEGLQLIHKKFLALLETQGVLSFESVGTPFNHEIHDAIAMAEYDGSEKRTVIDELRRGYLWNNELLRPAQVRVSG